MKLERETGKGRKQPQIEKVKKFIADTPRIGLRGIHRLAGTSSLDKKVNFTAQDGNGRDGSEKGKRQDGVNRPVAPKAENSVPETDAGRGDGRDGGSEIPVGDRFEGSEEFRAKVDPSIKMALEAASLEDGGSMGQQLTQAVSVYHHVREAARLGEIQLKIDKNGVQTPTTWPFLDHLMPGNSNVGEHASQMAENPYKGGESYGLGESEEINERVHPSVKMALEAAAFEDGGSINKQLSQAVSVYHHTRESMGPKYVQYFYNKTKATYRPVTWPFLEHLNYRDKNTE